MGFKTIDLDAPGGYERYNKMKKTNSVKKAFAEEESEVKKDDNEKIQDIQEKEPEVNEEAITLEFNILVQGVVTGVDQLRVRNKPEGDILYMISKDSIVKILEDHDGWLKVETAPGRVGYVMKAYIQVRTEGG